MVWQAAKRLGADDVVDLVVLDQLDHLGGQQPALTHLDALTDVTFGRLDGAFKVAGRLKVAVLLDQANHVALSAAQEFVDPAQHRRNRFSHAVQVVVKDDVVGAVKQKVVQARADHLAPFREQELLEVVVAQRRIFDIDLADDADLDLLFPAALHLHKALDDVDHQLGDSLPAQQLFAEQLLGHGNAVVHRLLAVALMDFIGDALVIERHDQIPAQHAVQRLQQHRHRQRESAGLLAFHKTGGDDRDVAVAALVERLAQQIDVVGSAAAAAGLGNQQRHLVQRQVAVLQRVDHLADDQLRRVAGVVMYVFQSLLDDAGTAVVQHLYLVPVVFQHVAQNAEVDGQHGGNQDGVGLFHFLGKRHLFDWFHRWIISSLKTGFVRFRTDAFCCAKVMRAFRFPSGRRAP